MSCSRSDSSTNAKCRTAKLLPYCPLLKRNAHLMNLTSRPIGVMQKKQAFIGILLLSLALVPRTTMAELNDGSLSSTGQSPPVHQEANTDSDQRFLAAFRVAHLPLIEAIAIAERLHVGSRTAGISFDTSDNPSYRVRTVPPWVLLSRSVAHRRFKSNWLRSRSEIKRMVSKQSPSIGISRGKTTFQLSPSGKTVTAMFGGHLLTSFSSSLIAASSSAAVFEGFLGFEPATGIIQLHLNQPQILPPPLAIRASAR